MLVEERHRAILGHLSDRGRLTVEEAARLLGVSPDTIRRDFRRLSEEGLVARSHGGILAPRTLAADSRLEERSRRRRAQKLRIAEAAAELLMSSETVAVDAGSTTVEVVPHLARLEAITIVAYSLDVAAAGLRLPGATCIMVGGVIRPHTRSAVGPEALAMIRRFHLSTAVIGANAVDIELGLMTPNRMEAEVKSALIDAAERILLLADSSKLEARALVSFAQLRQVDVLITDTDADPGVLARIRRLGPQVLAV